MGNPAAIISEVLTVYDDLDPTIVTAGSSTARKRPKLLRGLQLCNDFVHNFREWSWTYTESSILSDSGAPTAALPTDFMELGESYTMYDEDRGIFLTYRPPFMLQRERKQSRSTSQRNIFSIFDGKLQFPYNAGTTIRSLTLFHRIRPEILADDATAMLVPDKYTNTVLIPGVVAFDADMKNDARELYRGQFTDGLKAMAAAENPGKQGRKPPMAIHGAW